MAGTKPEIKPPSLDSATEVRLAARDEEQAIHLQPLGTSGSSQPRPPDPVHDTAKSPDTKGTGSTHPKSRKGRLRNLQITAQRLTVAENSCRDVENRVTLLLRFVETLQSIRGKRGEWLGHASLRGGNGNVSASDIPHGIPPSTLDREQQILESIQLSCQHSQKWTRCYRELINIQIALVYPNMPCPL